MIDRYIYIYIHVYIFVWNGVPQILMVKGITFFLLEWQSTEVIPYFLVPQPLAQGGASCLELVHGGTKTHNWHRYQLAGPEEQLDPITYIYIYIHTHTRAHNSQCSTIMIGLIPMVVKFPTGTTNVAVACCEPAKSRLRLRHDIAGAPSRAAWAPSSAAAGAIAALRPGQWVTPATTGLTKVGFWLIYKLSNSKTAKVKT